MTALGMPPLSPQGSKRSCGAAAPPKHRDRAMIITTCPFLGSHFPYLTGTKSSGRHNGHAAWLRHSISTSSQLRAEVGRFRNEAWST
eukprot:CAMPEP_0204062314 /NCGR_PEP_ID=MMETSP0360-20130528/143997_1 /ASSEMBLY_ACC=CAM_ASM_000342 /TAXON_ID=268821 /ORGANISM="Scrippsiella Hangoei, Strain SHTV-5" /LENGTH=86 /DNA_ID=CAMNT_0051010097 /DNA_START=139 /DNA_END=396 /DNA_ORIENTATION=+